MFLRTQRTIQPQIMTRSGLFPLVTEGTVVLFHVNFCCYAYGRKEKYLKFFARYYIKCIRSVLIDPSSDARTASTYEPRYAPTK